MNLKSFSLGQYDGVKNVDRRDSDSYQQRKPKGEEEQLAPVLLFCVRVVGWGERVRRFTGKV